MNIYQKSINAARLLSAAAITNANSGHTGSCLSAAPIMFTLFRDHMMFVPTRPNFENRDRFVLSNGHIAPLYYSILHMFGYDVSTSDLKNLRKHGSKTPGHPEVFVTPGVEVSTGPLGQGVANAVGLAIAQRYQGKKFNTINMSLFDNYTYCLCGDGCLMEGVAQEAASLAGALGLNKLILLYDQNDITIDGKTSLTSHDDTKQKFLAMNWNVIVVRDGNNHKKISAAIAKAKQSKYKPTLIICKTHIGFGTEYEDSEAIHGKALTHEELDALKEVLGVDVQDFEIPEDVYSFCREQINKNSQKYDRWQENFFLFEKTYPELFKVYQQFVLARKMDYSKLEKSLFKDISEISGRDANSLILNETANKMLGVIGGTADLGSSVKCYLKNYQAMSNICEDGRNIHFGVREHAMGSICNGIALYSSLLPFCSTFLTFSNYMMPAIRMAAMMRLPVNFFFTHDSLFVGEDGPTHQPIEQIAQLRAVLDNFVYRPATTTELLACFDLAYSTNCPNCFVLSRQSLPQIESTSFTFAKRGGYLLESDGAKIDVALFASGSELSLALDVKKELNDRGYKVSVSSFPCLEQFEKQTSAYKKSVVAPTAKLRVAIECSDDKIWYKYLNPDDLFIGVKKYGKSGNGKVVYEKYGFNVKDITKKVEESLKH